MHQTIVYTAIPYRVSTGPKQGFPCVVLLHREKPVFIAGFPIDENRFLPVGNTIQGKPCFHYRNGFAVLLNFSSMWILSLPILGGVQFCNFSVVFLFWTKFCDFLMCSVPEVVHRSSFFFPAFCVRWLKTASLFRKIWPLKKRPLHAAGCYICRVQKIYFK